MSSKNLAILKNPPAVNTQIIIESIGPETDKAFKTLAKIKKIKSMEEFEIAAAQVKFLKSTKKLAKAEEKRLIDPIQKWIDKHFSPFYKKVDTVETEIKSMMAVFLEGNKKKIEQLEEDVASGKIKNISKYVSKVSSLTIDSENASTRKTWKAIIKDESKIPRKFLQPNAALINEHLRKGGKPIPGVSWEQVEGISI